MKVALLRSPARSLVVSLLCVSVVACAPEEEEEIKRTPVILGSGTVSAAGGDVTLTEGELKGTTVIVPAGAVDGDVEITIGTIVGIGMKGAEPVSHTIYLGPEGQQFKKPVTLVLPYQTGSVSQAAQSGVSVLKRSEATGKVVDLGADKVAVDAVTGVVRTEVTSFSSFEAAIVPRIYGAFTLTDPDMWNGGDEILIIKPDNTYFNWSPENGDPEPPAELGSFTWAGGKMTDFRHTQNGRGGFDNDQNTGPYGGSVAVTPTIDALKFPGFSFNRVMDMSNPIAGAWELEGAGLNHQLVFLSGGKYFMWCNDQVDGCDSGASEGAHEFGTYNYVDDILSIDSVSPDIDAGFSPGVTATAVFSDEYATLTLDGEYVFRRIR